MALHRQAKLADLLEGAPFRLIKHVKVKRKSSDDRSLFHMFNAQLQHYGLFCCSLCLPSLYKDSLFLPGVDVIKLYSSDCSSSLGIGMVVR